MGVYYSLNKENECIHNNILKGIVVSNIHTNKRKHFGSRKYSRKSNFYIIEVINITAKNKNIFDHMSKSSEIKSIDKSQAISNPSMNSRECVSPTLPRRKSPTHVHAKIFNSCVPLSGLRRSLSLPKQNSLFNKNLSPESRFGILGSKCLSRNNSKGSATEGNASPVGVEHSPSSTCSKDPLFKWKSSKHNQSYRDKRDKDFDCGQDNLVFENCLDCIDDQTTNTTTISSDYTPSTDDCSSIFYDPILAKLEAELPVPPPPPRACPPWLKAALAKQEALGKEPVQKFNFKDRCCVSSSLQLPTTQLSPLPSDLDQHKAYSLGNSRFNVRIYPIIQNGVKISDTHYWLLDPPRSKTLRDNSTLMRRATECVRVPPSSPLDIYSTIDGYTNIESTSLCPPDELPLKDVKLRRGKSENCKDFLKNWHKELVLRLMKEVPQATESECQAVLIGSSYDYEEATRRLKFELLCRKGYVSRSHSKRLLCKYNWDLDAAISRARYEYEFRKLKRQEREQISFDDQDQSSYLNQTRGRSKYLAPHSSTSSDSSSSPLPCSIHHQSVISPWYDEDRRSNLF